MKTLKIVVVDGGSQAKTLNDGINTSSQPSDKEKNKAAAAAKKEAAKTAILAQYATSMMISTVKQTANYFISDIGRRHGDSNYQQQINRSIEIAKDGLGLLGATASGAAMGGPVGAVLGFTAGAINLGFKYAERERAYQHEMFRESNSQAYNLSRANFSALTGRLR